MLNKEIEKNLHQNQLQLGVHTPLAQVKVKNLKEHFRIMLTYSSNAIEGNELNQFETKVVVEEGIAIGGKRLSDHLDTVGHARAFDYLWGLARDPGITEEEIKKLHSLCFQPGKGDSAGNYRTINVEITGSKHNDKLSRHEDIEKHMQNLIESLSEKRASLHPVEYAAMLHQDFITIHPFPDGNGRIARLLMNHALLAAGYPPVIIMPACKQKYIQALEKSHINKEDFVCYIAEQEVNAQQEYMRLLRIS